MEGRRLQRRYQVCDDSTAQAANYDTGKCSQNGNAYATNDSLVGVLGTYNSPCAAIIIPLLNKAKGGADGTPNPEAIPSLGGEHVAVPHREPAPARARRTERTSTTRPTTRNYLRVAPSDDYQGAFVAEFAKDQGVKKAYILNDKESYGEGVAGTTRRAMERVGIEIVGDEAWNPKASSYEALMKKIKGTGADAVFLGGLISENGGQVIKDKVAVLGPNDGAVKLFAPDGFQSQSSIDESGGAAAGGFFSNAGAPVDKITGAARGVQRPAEGRRARGQAVSVRDVRRAVGGDHARRDRGLGRHAGEHPRAAVRGRVTDGISDRSRSTRTATRWKQLARSSAFTMYKATTK